jgi:hypothetical protein
MLACVPLSSRSRARQLVFELQPFRDCHFAMKLHRNHRWSSKAHCPSTRNRSPSVFLLDGSMHAIHPDARHPNDADERPIRWNATRDSQLRLRCGE